MCSSALKSRGKPAVSLISGGPTFDIEKNPRNGANLKLRHALRAGREIKGATQFNYSFYEHLSSGIKTISKTL